MTILRFDPLRFTLSSHLSRCWLANLQDTTRQSAALSLSSNSIPQKEFGGWIMRNGASANPIIPTWDLW